MNQSYRESHQCKGLDYDQSFRTSPHRAMVWRIEQSILDHIVSEFLPSGPGDYLDFACGTGRVLAFLGERARSSVGIDVSKSMLAEARKRFPTAELHCADLTREKALGDRRFDLVSAFRFFPNAEDDLRRDAIVCLVQHLRPSGLLVFNNHCNATSLPQRFARRLRRRNPVSTQRLMSRDDVEELVAGAGLRVVREFPLASLPLTENHMLRPVALFEWFERILTRIPATCAIAQNIIYVCRRA